MLICRSISACHGITFFYGFIALFQLRRNGAVARRCPETGGPLEWVAEPNYFLQLAPLLPQVQAAALPFVSPPRQARAVAQQLQSKTALADLCTQRCEEPLRANACERMRSNGSGSSESALRLRVAEFTSRIQTGHTAIRARYLAASPSVGDSAPI